MNPKWINRTVARIIQLLECHFADTCGFLISIKYGIETNLFHTCFDDLRNNYEIKVDYKGNAYGGFFVLREGVTCSDAKHSLIIANYNMPGFSSLNEEEQEVDRRVLGFIKKIKDSECSNLNSV